MLIVVGREMILVVLLGCNMNIRFVFYGLILFLLIGIDPALASHQGQEWQGQRDYTSKHNEVDNAAVTECIGRAILGNSPIKHIERVGSCIQTHMATLDVCRVKDGYTPWESCQLLEDFLCDDKRKGYGEYCRGYGHYINNTREDPVAASLDVYAKFRDQLVNDSGGFKPFFQIIIKFAVTLFIAMALLEMVWTFGRMVVGGTEFTEVSKELIIRIILFSFGMWILSNPFFAANIMFGLMEIVGEASGKGVSYDASGLLNIISKILDAFLLQLGWGGLLSPKTIFFAGCVLLILWAFGTAAGQLVLVLCELYITLTVGTLTLGFLPFEKTREFALRYFSAIIGVGLKLFTLQFIILICVELARNWSDALRTDDVNAFFGYSQIGVYTYVSMVIASLIMKEIAVKVPDAIQNLFAGASSGLSAAQAVGGGLAVMAIAKQANLPITTATRAFGAISAASAKTGQGFFRTVAGVAGEGIGNLGTGGGTAQGPAGGKAGLMDKWVANSEAYASKNVPSSPKSPRPMGPS